MTEAKASSCNHPARSLASPGRQPRYQRFYLATFGDRSARSGQLHFPKESAEGRLLENDGRELACLRIVLAVPRRSLIQEVAVRVVARETHLFRICRVEPAKLDDFRSHYELELPPRGIEDRATVIHMAVSMFETPEPCWELIERTSGRVGDRVAEVTLLPDRGVCVAKTGGPWHWSVWGRPAELQSAVAGYRYPG
jgi:hypothetical protein